MLDAIVDNRKKNCFQKSDGAFCGNKIVEVGEECDCGFDDAECQETCCYPRLVLSHLPIAHIFVAFPEKLNFNVI